MSDNRTPAWSRYSTRKHPKVPEGKPAWAKGAKSGRGKPEAKPNPNPYRMSEAPDAGLRRMLNNPRGAGGLLGLIERKRELVGDDWEDDF